jgi:hypothetical protein
MNVRALFGPIRQVAYVVPSVDGAARAWSEQLGAGPFAVAREVRPLAGSRYRGEPSGEVTLNLGFAYLGDVQLELIEQVDDTPSMYREAIDRGHRGLHHYAFCVDDFAAAYGHAVENGFDAIVDAGVPGVARMSYVESQRIPGLICELIEWNDLTRPYFDGIGRFLADADPAKLVHELELSALLRGDAR